MTQNSFCYQHEFNFQLSRVLGTFCREKDINESLGNKTLKRPKNANNKTESWCELFRLIELCICMGDGWGDVGYIKMDIQEVILTNQIHLSPNPLNI